MTAEDFIAEILDFHSPRVVVVSEYKDPRTGDTVRDTRNICRGCEVQWWPCTTYRMATGELRNVRMPNPSPEPFGTPRERKIEPRDDLKTREGRFEAEQAARREAIMNSVTAEQI